MILEKLNIGFENTHTHTLQIYQSSVAYSPDAIQTSGGYYHLGRVFLIEKKPEVAISLHNQVGWLIDHQFNLVPDQIKVRMGYRFFINITVWIKVCV